MPLAIGHNLSFCPRCGSPLSGIDGRCTNPKCSWPNPEPGPITALRLRAKGQANVVLQSLREVGKWPPRPW